MAEEEEVEAEVEGINIDSHSLRRPFWPLYIIT